MTRAIKRRRTNRARTTREQTARARTTRRRLEVRTPTPTVGRQTRRLTPSQRQSPRPTIFGQPQITPERVPPV